MDDRLTDMRRALLSAVNADGGWGYYPGQASRLEPTCWALLALSAQPDVPLVRTKHREFFSRSLRRDGLLLEEAVRDEDRPNLAFNGLAILLFANQKELTPDGMLDRVTSALLDHRGIKLPQSNLSPQDNSLQAWSWIDSTFSWVEPTCWCTLALKKARPVSRDSWGRISEAERLLVDRCCTAGGWNYGNANMLGQDLRPYVSTTALGLLAMQDRRQDP